MRIDDERSQRKFSPTKVVKKPIQNDIDKALAMFVDLDMSARKYKKLRLHNNQITDIDIYRSCKNILEAKERWVPENTEFSESGAKVDLISLLKHTITRILIQFDPNTLSQLSSEQFEQVNGEWMGKVVSRPHAKKDQVILQILFRSVMKVKIKTVMIQI